MACGVEEGGSATFMTRGSARTHTSPGACLPPTHLVHWGQDGECRGGVAQQGLPVGVEARAVACAGRADPLHHGQQLRKRAVAPEQRQHVGVHGRRRRRAGRARRRRARRRRRGGRRRRRGGRRARRRRRGRREGDGRGDQHGVHHVHHHGAVGGPQVRQHHAAGGPRRGDIDAAVASAHGQAGAGRRGELDPVAELRAGDWAAGASDDGVREQKCAEGREVAAEGQEPGAQLPLQALKRLRA